jgi:hypothetical protein
MNTLVSILKEENAALAVIAGLQAQVKEAVRGRRWADFDGLLAQVQQAGETLKGLEGRRIAVTGKGSFYQFAVSHTENQAEADKLCSLYRNLKLNLIRIKTQNESLQYYIQQSASLAENYLKGIAEAASGTGKLYTPAGVTPAKPQPGVLVEKSF